MGRDRYGRALVGAQVAALAGLAWPGRRRWPVPRTVRQLGWLAAVGGAAVATVAAARLGPDLSPLPEPPDSGTLHTDGLYGYVRHPIYAGMLTAGLGVAAVRGRPEPVVALAFLTAVLNAKADYEEHLLRARFGRAYADYAARTPAFVPRGLR